MNNYLLTAVFISIFIALTEILVVNGKNGKLVKIVTSLITVTAFLSPILDILNYSNDNSIVFDAEYSKYLEKVEKQMVESEVLGVIKTNNFSVKTVNAAVDNNEGNISTKKVEIILWCNGINCESEHINISKEVEKLIFNNVFNDEAGIEIVIEFERAS